MIFHAKNQQISEESSGTLWSGKDILAVVKICGFTGGSQSCPKSGAGQLLTTRVCKVLLALSHVLWFMYCL